MDAYTVEPIRQTLPENKQGAKRYYGKHPYFTTRAWNVIQAYINRFSKPDDLVLDPFGGSGVTAVEALILRRRAIHGDISPLSIFLAEQTAYSPINLIEVGEAFSRVKERCSEQINEWFLISDDGIAQIPIEHWYPKNYALPQNADALYVHELFTPRQLRSLALLRHAIMQEPSEVYRNLLLLTFSATLGKTNRTFVSASGRIESRGGSAIFSMYRYYIPEAPVELNVWDQFAMRFQRVLRAKEETNTQIGNFYSPSNFRALNISATDLLDQITEESVDYIFTDPPYGAHIAYLDLSAMWHAWLQLNVPEELRDKEAIEGGDVGHTKEDYFDLMAESLEQMFRALKYGRWMSLVFAHKDASYWNAIVTAAQNAGFEYVNSVPQSPNVVWSMHKKKNPLTVLTGNMILNFRKVKSPTTIAISNVGADAVQLIKNTAELVIVRNQGAASTDEIVNEIVVKLLENGLLGEVKTKIGDIAPLLQEQFVFSEIDDSWHIPRETRIGTFIPLNDRIKFYLTDYLKRAQRIGEAATIDRIVMNVLPQLINGETPEKQTILGILKEIAHSPDDIHWQLAEPQAQGEKSIQQLNLFDEEELDEVALPLVHTPTTEVEISHNSILYRLARLGFASGHKVWIGKKEQSAFFEGQRLSHYSEGELSFVGAAQEYTKGAVKQIDLIWLNDAGLPMFAFEIEHSTTIKTALERFVEILRVHPEIAEKLVILAPSKRKRKLDKELSASAFIGHPMYMETKVRYVFYDDFIKLYNELVNTPYRKQDISDRLRAILRRPIPYK